MEERPSLVEWRVSACREAVLAGALAALPLIARAESDAAAGWRDTLRTVAQSRDALFERLGRAHERLLKRARAERPDLSAKLQPEPPRPALVGYGLLPTLLPDEGPRPQEPAETRYELPGLAAWVERESGLLEAVERGTSSPTADLSALVDRYLLLRENFLRIDQHVRYHAVWQEEIHARSEVFAAANELLRVYRAWRAALIEHGPGSPEPKLRRVLEEHAVQFSSVPWHAGVREADGSVSLTRSIQTDVADETFLSSLASGVEAVFNDAKASREAGFRLRIAWQRVSDSTLYPEGPPARGTSLDLPSHVGRFGPGYVLTTGAPSTHLLGGRAIVLGPHPISPRLVAHEVAHLLGFHDSYFRAFEGSLDDPSGAVIWEIVPFAGSLMASPERGEFTEGMLRKLLDAYAPK